MIPKRELLEHARSYGVAPKMIEKDYVLGWILAGINQHNALKGKWIFKGGTCIKKCYFKNYRFSEDLDFTVIDESHIDIIWLHNIFKEVIGWIVKNTGITLPVDQIKFDLHPDVNKKYVEGRLYYVGPLGQRGSLTRIILDISSNEILVLPQVEREIYHLYSDHSPGFFKASCYCYEELFAEKLRAIMERARPRDLYDIINLYYNRVMISNKVLLSDTLRKKCEFKNVDYPSLESIASPFDERT